MKIFLELRMSKRTYDINVIFRLALSSLISNQIIYIQVSQILFHVFCRMWVLLEGMININPMWLSIKSLR